MRCTWLLLLLAAPLARAQCADGAPPVCSDGTDAAPPGDGLPCASGAPSCADGTTLSAPGGDAPAGGGTSSGGTGSTTATGCSPTTCTADGLSNYVQRSYTYGADGKITGTIKTNNCITHSVSSGSSGTFSCEEQTFPDPSYASTPAAIPLLGRAGMSLAGGNNIYSMFEAGFGSGTQPKPCGGTVGSGTYGECDGGLSVELCELHLAAICPGEERTELMLDQCGGHASPYHFHADLVCEYDLTTGTHSRATGAALDGHIIYGKYETGTTAPVDLDVCNGHTGAVPADSDYGFTSGTVYHYHMTDAFPHTIGCYGPVADEAACRALYPSECNGDYTPTAVAVAGETLTYNVELYCPCTYPAGDTAVVTSPPPPVAASPPPVVVAASPPPVVTASPPPPVVVTSPPPSPPPTSAAGASLRVEAQLSFSALDMQQFDDPVFESAFRTEFITTVAGAAGVEPRRVTVDSITAGSVAVAFTVQFPLTATAAQTTFTNTLATATSSVFASSTAMQSYGAVTAVVFTPPPPGEEATHSPPPALASMENGAVTHVGTVSLVLAALAATLLF